MLGCVSGIKSGYWGELPGRHVDVGQHLDEEGDSKTTLSPRKKTPVLGPPKLVSGCRGAGTEGPVPAAAPGAARSCTGLCSGCTSRASRARVSSELTPLSG